MTRDVTIDQDAKRDVPVALNRRTVLGALSLGLVAAACDIPGAGKDASVDESKKSVGLGSPGAEEEIKVALPSRENPADGSVPVEGAMPSIDEPKGSGGGAPAKEMPAGGSVPKVGEVKAPEKKASEPAPVTEEPEEPEESVVPGAPVEPKVPEPVAPAPAAPGVPVPDEPLSLGTGVEAIRVANRLTFGTTNEVQADIAARGTAGFIENQLALDTPDPAVEAVVADFSTFGVDPRARFQTYTNGKDAEVGRVELTHANIIRATSSANQLHEVMCQLWMDHFNIKLADDDYESLVTGYQEEAIRPFAMGKFSDLLKASAGHPGMLHYLDAATNDASDPEGINENYGREILELHTLGVNPQIYNEDDVRSAAFAFTGWTFDMNQDSPTFLDFQFNEAAHFTEEITLLEGGFSRGATTGKATGDALLEYLAAHPQTAVSVATKLLIRFVDDTPSEELIASTAAVFTANETEIVPTLVHIFNSQDFADSDGEKLRRPFESMVASLRCVDAEIPADPSSEAAVSLRNRCNSMGNEPWMYDTPDGYSDFASEWLSTSTVLDQWNVCAEIASNRLSDGLTVNLVTLRGVSATAGELVVAMANQFGLGPIAAETQTAVLAAVDADAGAADLGDEQVQDIASLLFAHPLFQIR